MIPNTSPSSYNRASYGFQLQEQNPLRSPKKKGFPTLNSHQGETSLTGNKNPESKWEELMASSKIVHQPHVRQSKFPTGIVGEHKPAPASKEQSKEQSSKEHLFRGSHTHLLKFPQVPDGGLGLSNILRNTTKFTMINKLATPKNQTEIASKTAQNIKDSVPRFLKPPEINKTDNGSKTPSKIFNKPKVQEKQPSRSPFKLNTHQGLNKDSSAVKFLKPNSSKTFINNQSTISKQAKGSAISKASAISKGSTDTSDKKTWKTLNQIAQSKNRQKMALNGGSGTNRTLVVNGFQIGSQLGKGKFGDVYLSRHQQAGFLVALKKINKSKVVQFKMVPQFCTQIRLHSCLNHPNIVRFYGCFQDPQNVYLVMQYMNGGTLFDYLNQVGTINLRQTVSFLQDIIQALIYMHQKFIAHRDIKPQNIVISSQGVAKLCDFGWSAVIQSSRKTYCGTFDYAPPQMLQRKHYDQSVDVWCVGVLTYQLLTGRVPFEGQQRSQVMQKILSVDRNKIDYPVALPIEARQFIQALVQKDPAQRPKMSQLLEFKLFSLYPRKLKKMA